MSQQSSARRSSGRRSYRLLTAAAAVAALAWVPLSRAQLAPTRAGFPTPAANPPAAPPVTPTGQPAGPANGPAIAPANPPAAPVDAPTPPAVADIQQQIDQKQFAAAIKAASKLLSLHGDAATGFSRFQVTMLKGDAQAGSKALGAARATYQSAVHETRDPHEQALATWTVELFRKAKGTTYVPHVVAAAGAAAPIDLLDRDSRKVAFAALLDDELSVMGPSIKQAIRTPSLPQIFPVVQRVQALTELDEIANGSDARTSAVAGGLLDHARNLMANALKGMWTRISDIHASATQQVTTSGPTSIIGGQPVQPTITGQNGLTTADMTELRQMVDTCRKIHDAAETFMPLSNGGADKEWGAVLNDANRVAGRANDVLSGNYSSVSTQYPTDGYDNGNATGYDNGSTNYPNGYPGTAYPNGTNVPGVTVTGGNTPSSPGTTPGGGSGSGNTPTPPASGTGGGTPPPVRPSPPTPTNGGGGPPRGPTLPPPGGRSHAQSNTGN